MVFYPFCTQSAGETHSVSFRPLQQLPNLPCRRRALLWRPCGESRDSRIICRELLIITNEKRIHWIACSLNILFIDLLWFTLFPLLLCRAKVLIAIFASTFSSGLISLVGAPRILQALAEDELIPFLSPFSVCAPADCAVNHIKPVAYISDRFGSQVTRERDNSPVRGYLLTYVIGTGTNTNGMHLHARGISKAFFLPPPLHKYTSSHIPTFYPFCPRVFFILLSARLALLFFSLPFLSMTHLSFLEYHLRLA